MLLTANRQRKRKKSRDIHSTPREIRKTPRLGEIKNRKTDKRNISADTNAIPFVPVMPHHHNAACNLLAHGVSYHHGASSRGIGATSGWEVGGISSPCWTVSPAVLFCQARGLLDVQRPVTWISITHSFRLSGSPHLGCFWIFRTSNITNLEQYNSSASLVWKNFSGKGRNS